MYLWSVQGADPNWLEDKAALELRAPELEDLIRLLNELLREAHTLRYLDDFLVDIAELVVLHQLRPGYDLLLPLAVVDNGPKRLGVCLLCHRKGDAQAAIVRERREIAQGRR